MIGEEGVAGPVDLPVVVVGETPLHYRVRLLEDGWISAQRLRRRGDIVLVPKGAVSFSVEEAADAR